LACATRSPPKARGCPGSAHNPWRVGNNPIVRAAPRQRVRARARGPGTPRRNVRSAPTAPPTDRRNGAPPPLSPSEAHPSRPPRHGGSLAHWSGSAFSGGHRSAGHVEVRSLTEEICRRGCDRGLRTCADPPTPRIGIISQTTQPIERG
jgi:hypothetical protein